MNWQGKIGFADFRLERKFTSLISRGSFEKKEILLALPETFMNKSGQALGKIVSFYKIKITNLVVVHDDADLQKGEVRISKNRGTAGHKGLDSIVGVLKTKNFTRIRIGVRPKNYVAGSKLLDKFVLKKFTKEEEKIIKETIKKTCQAIEFAIKEGLEKTMTKFN